MLATPELEISRNLPAPSCSVEEAQRYTRWLATHHYENFNVVSRLLPKHLHQHFYNVYAYCRWSDDLGDEVPDRQSALELLDAWKDELRLCYSVGERPTHPVLIALGETIRAKDIPHKPFSDLLRAFRQDQWVQRYATWDAVLDYCSYSANPVGRLVLYLCGYRDAERQQLSDYTCTALQLANFWQDVSRDLEKGRIYIPLDALAAHAITEREIVERRFSERYVSLMKDLIARTRSLFTEGMPLARSVEGVLRTDIEMFCRGGLAVLDSIETSGYDTLNHRPSISKWKQLQLLTKVLAGRAIAGDSRQDDSPLQATSQDTAANFGAPGAITTNVTSENVSVRDSYVECNRIARAAKSSFYLAFFGLPREKRNALFALYAFMRLIDNVSDGPGELGAKRRGLARWRNMLDDAISGDTSGHVILPALANSITGFHIPTRYFHDLILGAETDLTVSSYATFDQLSEYCYRVAGTVGLTCLHVFGFRDPRAPDLAERLGLAFQLTNIIRDVKTDLEMGRVYLPQEDVERFCRCTNDLLGPLTERVKQLLEFEADRAWQFYEEGGALIQKIEPDSRATLCALVRTYSTLLARIEERDFDVFSSRVSLSSAEKAGHLIAARLAFGGAGSWKGDAIAKRPGNRRRPGGSFLGRRAG